MAIETGISVRELLATPDDILDEMLDILQERHEKQEQERLRSELKTQMG